MVRVITLNVNGIRSAATKGFYQWLARQRADFVCLQELRANVEQLDSKLFYPRRFHCYYKSAEKKGYSGVALYSLAVPDKIITAYGDSEFDQEGRYIEGCFGDLSVVSVYAPSGSSGDARQQAKYRFLKSFMKHLQGLKRKRRRYIICGDINIAHKEIDLKNWRANRKNSGFLDEERQWLDTLFSKVGYCDAFRRVCPAAEQYTWWSNRGRAWEKNVGWRIDYQLTSSPSLIPKSARIYKAQRFSDHAPLIMDYRLDAQHRFRR